MQKCHRLLSHRQDEANGKQDGTDGKFAGHNGCVKNACLPKFLSPPTIATAHTFAPSFRIPTPAHEKKPPENPQQFKKGGLLYKSTATATESLRSFSAPVLNHSIYLCSSFSASCVSYLSPSSRNMFISSCMINFRFSHLQIYDNDLAIRV